MGSEGPRAGVGPSGGQARALGLLGLVPPAGKEGQVLGPLVGEAGSGLRGPMTVVLLVDGAVFSLSYLPGLVLTGWRVGAGPSPNKQGRRFENGRCQHQCPQGKD